MKLNVMVGLENCILDKVNNMASEKGISRSALLRAAIYEYLGEPHTELVQKAERKLLVPKTKTLRPFKAYGGGQYLGSFASQEEAEDAKREATRKVFYVVLTRYDDFWTVVTSDTAMDDFEYMLRVESFIHTKARRRVWDEFANGIGVHILARESARLKILQAFEDIKVEQSDCVFTAVVA